jgi:hypothetical protein
MSTSPCGALSPGLSCAACSPRPTIRSGGPTSRSGTATVTSCPSGTTRWAGTLMAALSVLVRPKCGQGSWARAPARSFLDSQVHLDVGLSEPVTAPGHKCYRPLISCTKRTSEQGLCHGLVP